MVLVVVTKGQQEALIPLAPVQKQCTGMRALNKCSAGFSHPDCCWRSLKVPSHPSQVQTCLVIPASWRNAHVCIWSVVVKPVCLLVTLN